MDDDIDDDDFDYKLPLPAINSKSSISETNNRVASLFSNQPQIKKRNRIKVNFFLESQKFISFI